MEKNKLGNASLVLGILALAGSIVPVVCLYTATSLTGIVATLVSIVLGYVLGYGFAGVSIILGLIGAFKKDCKKITAILGILFSIIAIALPFIYTACFAAAAA